MSDRVVNIPALRAALETLKAHEDLIEDCICEGRVALEPRTIHRHEAQSLVLDALYRICDDDWRSEENPGTS